MIDNYKYLKIYNFIKKQLLLNNYQKIRLRNKNTIVIYDDYKLFILKKLFFI